MLGGHILFLKTESYKFVSGQNKADSPKIKIFGKVQPKNV